MRILLAPHGTRGDVQPMLALGLALRSRGHLVGFVAPDNCLNWISGLGFHCEPDGVDFEATLQTPEARLQSWRWMIEQLRTVVTPRLFTSVARAAAAWNPELIVGSGVQVAASSVAERRGIPSVGVVFAPCAIPSGDAPPPIVRRQTLPRFVNRALWRWGAPLADAALRGPINAGRAGLGLGSVARPTRMLGGQKIIVASDRELGPFPSDAPTAAVATDAWILDRADTLPPDLERFLDAGAPPVYLGLGSMVAGNAPALAAISVAAARAVGCRLVIVGGWARLDRTLVPSDIVMPVREAPHYALFPRVAGAIHHGGAGTTTAAARAGVPQLILPHILDQYYWAQRVDTLGLGPAALPVERVTTERLIPRLRSLVDSTAFRDNTRALGKRVAGRNGIADAVAILEKIVERRR